MSKNSQDAFFSATVMAVATFLLAFGCLWTLGDFGFSGAAFFAAVIAAIVWIVLYIGMGSPNQTGGNVTPTSAAAPAPAPAADVASSPAAAAATPVREPSAEAAEAKAKADAQAAERAAAEEERRKVEQEKAAEAKRKADEAAAAAKQKADEDAAEAKRREEEAAAAKAAGEDAEPVQTDNAAAATTPDYDGDGVREGTDEGKRPTGLDAPRDGKADDLKQIKGIGAKMEELCNRLGFWHFDQIASWSADEVAWVDANLEGFKGRVTRDTWVEQARVLAGGGETEFSKRVEDGDVY